MVMVSSVGLLVTTGPTLLARESEGQEQAPAEIQRLGGTVEVDEKRPGKPVSAVMLTNNVEVTDNTLAHLEGLTTLTHLWLGSTSVTDAGLAHLQGLTGPPASCSR